MYKNEKYGFIYIWRDRKYARYYVGCHWGTIDDGYICSSDWMKKSYRNRPTDFKRRIIGIVKTKPEMFELEYLWLNQIKNEELGKKYYNFKNTKWEHWSQNEDSTKTTIEKMKINQRIALDKLTPEERKEKFGNRRGKPSPNIGRHLSDEQKEHLRQINLGKKKPEHSARMKGRPSLNKGKKASDETRAKISAAQLGRKRGPRSEETKRKIGEKNKINMQKLWEDKSYQEQQRTAHIGYIMPQAHKNAISLSLMKKNNI